MGRPRAAARALLLITFVVSGAGSAPVRTVRLGDVGFLKTVGVALDGQNLTRVVVDTGSPDLVVLACSTNRTSQCFVTNRTCTAGECDSPCLSLTVDHSDHAVWSSCVSLRHLRTQLLGAIDSGSRSTADNSKVAVALGINVSDPKMHAFDRAAGVLGLAYPGLSDRKVDGATTFDQLLVNATGGAGKVFGLDFREPSSSHGSWLHLGGVDPEYEAALKWGEYQFTSPLKHHVFQMHQPEICGVSLTQSFSRNWPAMVDSGSDCLALPREFLELVQAWTPIAYCTVANAAYDRDGNLESTALQRQLCFVEGNRTATDDLPWFSFRMSDGGAKIYLPLSSLLLGFFDSLGNQALCLAQSSPAGGTEVDENGEPLKFTFPYPEIVLGSLPLRALYFASNRAEGRLALANTINASAELAAAAAESCVSSPHCKGDQRFSIKHNECAAPACGLYLFTVTDDESKTCRIDPTLATVMVVFLSTMLLCECVHHTAHRRINSRLLTHFEGSEPVPALSSWTWLTLVLSPVGVVMDALGDLAVSAMDAYIAHKQQQDRSPHTGPGRSFPLYD